MFAERFRLPQPCRTPVPETVEAVFEAAGEIVKKLKARNGGIKRIRKRIRETRDRIKSEREGRAFEIRKPAPGIGAAIISEAFDSTRRADLLAPGCCSGVVPAAKRSGRLVLVQRRFAACQRRRR